MVTPTPARIDLQARSVGLVQAKGHTYRSVAAHLIGFTLDDGALACAAYHSDRAHNDGQYVTTYSAASDRATCECNAAQHRRPCWHVGLTLICARYVARLHHPAGRAETEAEYRCARALGF